MKEEIIKGIKAEMKKPKVRLKESEILKGENIITENILLMYFLCFQNVQDGFFRSHQMLL